MNLVEFFENNPGYLKWGTEKVAQTFGFTPEEVRAARRIAQGKEETTNYLPTNKNENSLKNDDLPYTTLDEYCIYLGLDPTKVDKYNDVKYWSDSRGRQRFSIVSKQEHESTDYANLFIESIRGYSTTVAPDVPKKISRDIEECVSVINMYDAHIDKMSINGRGGQNELEHNIWKFKAVFLELMENVNLHNLVIFPIGNDLFNTNGFINETKKGTLQENIVSHDVAFKATLNLMRWCIDILRKNAKRIYIPIIRGNHDTDAMFYFGECLVALYDGCHDITIDNSQTQRKYVHHKSLLLGFAHGDKEKNKMKNIPMYMATEQPKAWGEATTKMFFLGDIHHKEEYMMMKSKDSFGCEIRFLPAITSDNKWHVDEGWIGANKSAEIITFKLLSKVIVNVTKKL